MRSFFGRQKTKETKHRGAEECKYSRRTASLQTSSTEKCNDWKQILHKHLLKHHPASKYQQAWNDMENKYRQFHPQSFGEYYSKSKKYERDSRGQDEKC